MRRTELALLLLLLAVALILALIGFGIIPLGGSSGGEELKIDQLPAEFLKSVYYANQTQHGLSSIASGIPPTSLPREDDVASTARRIERLIEELEGSDTTPAGEKIVNAGYAYEELARAAGNATHSARILAKILPRLEKALKFLENCNITGFLDAYTGLEENISTARASLEQALLSLASISPDFFLSDSHRETYKLLNKTVASLLFALNKLEEFYRYALSNPSLAEKLCRIAKQLAKPGDKDREEAAKLLQSLSIRPSPGKCKLAETGIGHPLAEIVAGLKNLVSQQPASETGDQAGGTGAGYGQPESDD